MKILTVRQPWASALMRTDPGRKNIENRTWSTQLRGRIAIHASARIDRPALAVVPNANTEDLARVLGVIQIIGCHIQNSAECLEAGCESNPWAQFSEYPDRPIWHWNLENPRSFVTPIRAKGALQLWEPTPSVAYLIEIGDYTS